MVWMWEGQEPTGALIHSRWTTVWLFLSLGCWCSSLCHNQYVCIRVSVLACRVRSLGSLTVCTGCLLLPSCEEQGSDMACPFSSLRTFDTLSAEVSLTYFPLAALLLSCSAPQQGGQRGRSCLRLHCCPGVLNHRHLLGDTFLCLRVCVCVLRCVGGIPHTQTNTLTHTGLCWGCIWSALWGLQVDAGQHLGRTPAVSSVWLTLCTTAHTLWPLPPNSLPSVL